MNILKDIMVMRAGLIPVLILGISSSHDISANFKNEWKHTSDRVWNVCTHKLPKLVLTGVKGAVTICSFYLFCKCGYCTFEKCRALTDSPSMNLLKLILKEGCLTAGVGLLTYEVGESFLRDLEKT